MQYLRALFLITVLLSTSGYRFRCYWLCTDQTAVQNDYIEQRDRCRDYAQLKLETSIRSQNLPNDDKVKKSELVSLFSQCMAENGWNIPDGKDKDKAEKAPVAAAVAAVAPVPPVKAMAKRYEEKAALSRASECAFARHAAANSTVSAARAKACDLECAQRLQAAPDAPRPAACPADFDARLATGKQRNDEDVISP